MQQLTPNICAEFDKFIAKYPHDQKQSAVLSALMLMQQHNNGWLTVEAMDLVADYLDMPKIAVYEVASFYTLYDLTPVGKYKIAVCTNISCMLRGSDEIVAYLKNKLKIDFNQNTTDGKFTLKSVECLAACGGAPMMQIGPQYYENLTPTKIDKILEGLV